MDRIYVIFTLLLILALNPFVCYATQIEIIVDENKILNERKPFSVGGQNVNNSMMLIEVKDLIDPLKIPTVTFPAGNHGDLYDLTKHSLDFFALQQKILGNPHTFVQARLHGGKPEDAAKALAYVKEKGYRVDVWTIGNEPDLYATHKNDPSWTPKKYARVFREYAKAMKKIDPGVRLAGPAVSNPKDDWIKTFIRECGDLVDVLIWHWYPTDGNWSDEEALATAHEVKKDIKRYQSYLKNPEVNPKGYQRDIKLGITEYAIHWDTPKYRHLTDMVGAMWTAEVLGYFIETGLDYSHYFCLQNYGGHALIDKGYWERPVYYVFLFYAQDFGKKIIWSKSSDPKIKVVASCRNDGRRALILINQYKKGRNLVIKTKNGVDDFKAYLLNDKNWGNTTKKGLYVKENNLYLNIPGYSIISLIF